MSENVHCKHGTKEIRANKFCQAVPSRKTQCHTVLSIFQKIECSPFAKKMNVEICLLEKTFYVWWQGRLSSPVAGSVSGCPHIKVFHRRRSCLSRWRWWWWRRWGRGRGSTSSGVQSWHFYLNRKIEYLWSRLQVLLIIALYSLTNGALEEIIELKVHGGDSCGLVY